jgi:site-specific DNA recombinase
MTHHQPIRAAIYVRIASKWESDADVIASQVRALRARASQDTIALVEDLCFIDGGYSGASLVRPALTRLRNAAAAGTLDRLYVQSPDRLARTYVYQALLLDEFQRCGVEVIFLDLPLDGSADDQLLLPVQGMMTEEEGTGLLERHRQGGI